MLAERLMEAFCTVTRGAATQQNFDPVSGAYPVPVGTAVYTGPCRVKPSGNQAGTVEAAGQDVSLWPFVVSVPMAVTTVLVDDLVTVSTSTLDPQLVGKVFRVKYVEMGSHVTARRLGCEVRT